MEGKSPDSTIPPSKRSSIKTHSHFNNCASWKRKLRENCYKRVREGRSRLIWKMRLPTAESANDKELIKSAFQDIVTDELNKIKNSSSNGHPKSSVPGPEDNDILWEYDGIHDAYQGECEEILLEMQRIFYDDFRAEPTSKELENHCEIWDDEEDEYLAHAVFEHMKLNNEEVHKVIWCPICKQGELKENRQLIYCTVCELQLSKCNEVNLDILETRLGEAHAEHLNQGCRLKPNFCIERMFGLTALYIFCQGCNIFEVVV
uniref:Uncharacterized protein MANES_12G058800 n=1 Tax=Rhizophora mucronata TaxID=61149 RepID=A0A2P2MXQ2_RHIMU